MTWKEAQQAFKDRVPVVYNDRTVGAMDKNMNCVYKNTPEHFTRR